VNRARLFLLVAFLIPCGCEDPGLDRAPTDVGGGDHARVLFGGDFSFGENYLEAHAENVLETRGYDHCLERLAPLMRGADMVVVNLETPITDIAQSPHSPRKYYIHHSDPELTPAAMKRHNIGAVSLANNHAMDYGAPGLGQTIASLDRERIEWFGAGRNEREAAAPFRHDAVVGGDTVTILVAAGFEYSRYYDRAYHFFARDDTAGANNWTVERAAADVRRLRARHPGAFIVAFPHWGRNYQWRSRRQRAMARAIVDAGADLILGHSAHVIQQIERYRGRWIVYSLGNSLFNAPSFHLEHDKEPYSLLAALDVLDGGNPPRLRLRLYPLLTDNFAVACQPYLLVEEDCDAVERILLRRSAVPRHLREGVTRGRDQYGCFFEIDVSPRS
jgi:poly-gamma-glutamate capsule biosynthesis protein CapA/YwtB (metallophosphatase superfamily)